MPLYPPPPTSGSTTLAALTDVDTTGKADEDSLTWEASSSRWVPQAVTGSGILATLFDAKGDLIVASAADTAAREAVGADGTFLEANAASTNGVRWGTPSAGSLSTTYLGYNTAGGSSAAGGTTAFGKKVTLSGTKTFLNIGAYVAMTTLSFTTVAVALYADSAGSPVGAPLALGNFGDAATTPLVGAAPTTPSWIDVPLISQQAAGDYWIVWSLSYQGANWSIYYDGSGTDKEITMTDAAGAIEGIYRATLASASRKYSLRALVA